MPIIAFSIVLVVILLDTIYIKNYKAIRNLRYKMKIKSSNNLYCREVNTDYSPSIVSYLYNQKIEPEKDLISDILNLYARKIIDIKQVENQEDILFLNEENFEGEILDNDKYIIDTIVLHKSKFNYQEWLDKIIKVYREKVNVKNEKEEEDKDFEEGFLDRIEGGSHFDLWAVLAILALIPFAIILALIVEYVGIKLIIYFATIIFLIIILIPVVLTIKSAKKRDENLDMHLTEDAKEELKKWIRFENYIKSYTLLKERKTEEIEIFEQYIPYAMVLNINKKYKEEILKVLGKEEIKQFIASVNKYKTINNVIVQYTK